MESRDILKAIDAYSEASGLQPSTICQYAVFNGRLYRHLLDGNECLPRTARRLFQWMEDNPPNERRAGAAK